MKYGLLIVGYKGKIFLENFSRFDISFVRTYNRKDANTQVILKYCKQHNIKYYVGKDIGDEINSVSKVFCIGWQFLLNVDLNKIVVLHDSYLPELRGFCPTATSLILGNPYLGVTSFQPTGKLDDGPIYFREKVAIEYPITLKEAYHKINPLYIKMVYNIIDGSSTKELSISPSSISYSIWRDAEDMKIDWYKDSEYIVRFIHALSYPLSCAKTNYLNKEISVIDAKSIPDILFVERHPGKIWRIDGNFAIVVCGRGMIKIKTTNTFTKLRTRLK